MRTKSGMPAILLAAFMALGVGTVNAQINKALVEKAPKEELAPMPHVNPDDPTVMRLKQDASTNNVDRQLVFQEYGS